MHIFPLLLPLQQIVKKNCFLHRIFTSFLWPILDMYVRISPESFCITKQLCIYNDVMIMAYKNVYQKLRS